jgi:hypothetical protein
MYTDKIRQMIIEAFKDLGKLSDDELQKGQALDKDKEGNFNKVDGRTFHTVLTKMIKKDALNPNPKGLDGLSLYTIPEYTKMKCFLGKNNSSGFCVKSDGDLVSVWSTQKSSGKAIVSEAIKNGAKKLDCFATLNHETGEVSGLLYKLYSSFGFKINTNLTTGDGSKPYDIVKGISYYTDGETVDKTSPMVVIFMKR